MSINVTPINPYEAKLRQQEYENSRKIAYFVAKLIAKTDEMLNIKNFGSAKIYQDILDMAIKDLGVVKGVNGSSRLNEQITPPVVKRDNNKEVLV